MLHRNSNWEKLLIEQLDQTRSRAFQWGVFDCALFACDCILAMTGTDPAAKVRGTYSSEKEAQALIGANLGEFAATIAGAFGMPPVRPTFARRGDVVLVDYGGESPALGIVGLDGRFAICAAPQGLERVHMESWLRAWKVG